MCLFGSVCAWEYKRLLSYMTHLSNLNWVTVTQRCSTHSFTSYSFNILLFLQMFFPLFSFLMSCKVESLASDSCFVVLSLFRVINAGKSTLNEDQACCEVLVVKRRPTGNSTPNRTPTARRRSSLPNGDGLNIRDYQVGQSERRLLPGIEMSLCLLYLQIHLKTSVKEELPFVLYRHFTN